MANFHPAASSLANFNNTILKISTTGPFCHPHLLPRRVVLLGCGQFCLIKRILDIKCMFPCSFGNKRMCSLTCVYGIILWALKFYEIIWIIIRSQLNTATVLVRKLRMYLWQSYIICFSRVKIENLGCSKWTVWQTMSVTNTAEIIEFWSYSFKYSILQPPPLEFF